MTSSTELRWGNVQCFSSDIPWISPSKDMAYVIYIHLSTLALGQHAHLWDLNHSRLKVVEADRTYGMQLIDSWPTYENWEE